MEGQPRARYEWRDGTRGVGVLSRRAAAAAGQQPGKRRANTSGADLRASEQTGFLRPAAAPCSLCCVYRRATPRARSHIVAYVAIRRNVVPRPHHRSHPRRWCLASSPPVNRFPSPPELRRRVCEEGWSW